MSDELPNHLRAVADFFGLPGTAAVAKDFHVVRAIKALAAIDAAPFDLVFGGGTALARAHRIIRRMSEDVDFKIVPRAPAPINRSALRRQLERLRHSVSSTFQATGFAFDPKNRSLAWAQDEGRYAVWQFPMPPRVEQEEGCGPQSQSNSTMLRSDGPR